MTVKVGRRMHQMSEGQFRCLLQTASEQIPFGVYAVEKGDYAEMRWDKCQSMTQLKALIRQFRQRGFKVHYNGR